MDTNSGKLLAKGEVFQIVGCAIEVLNTLGHGLLEKMLWQLSLVYETFLSCSNLCSVSSIKGTRSASLFPI